MTDMTQPDVDIIAGSQRAPGQAREILAVGLLFLGVIVSIPWAVALAWLVTRILL